MVVHILVGLPGSGKTTFARECAKLSGNACVLDYDKFLGERRLPSFDMALHRCNISLEGYSTVFIDGLFLRVADVCGVVGTLVEYFQAQPFSVVLDVWERNREQCLANDCSRVNRGDRELSSRLLIMKGRCVESGEGLIEALRNEYCDVDVTLCNHKVYGREEK